MDLKAMNQKFQPTIEFCLSYEGNDSDHHTIDLYDVSQALIGFQRSLALTTHLVINGEIITQAPSLKGAKILASPAQEGSWEIIATILAGAYAIGTASKATPIGHIVHSLYDYIISKSLGVHVDYDKSIGQLVEEHKKKTENELNIGEHKVNSLIEKCNTALIEIHRPIAKNKTATRAIILAKTAGVPEEKIQVGPTFTLETFAYIHEEITEDEPVVVEGRISSYNTNTFRGRIFASTEGRPIPFELANTSRTDQVVALLTASLTVTAVKDYDNEWSSVYCRAFRTTTKNGHLKSYKIIEVSHTIIS
ncbi:MAG: hypothetical protein QTN59_12995 [Candidatus Electrothrix communis]|nr:MAG: hypothetical protein QTN59_12995 [Candidatus Electrothrix communis]